MTLAEKALSPMPWPWGFIKGNAGGDVRHVRITKE